MTTKTVQPPEKLRKEEFGNIFKQQREKRNVSLKEVSSATSIRINYLRSIESGTIAKQLPPIYAKGFIMQYAEYLELNGEKLVKQYANMIPQPSYQNKLECEYGLGSLEYRDGGLSKAYHKSKGNFFWGVSLIVIVVLTWLLAKYIELI